GQALGVVRFGKTYRTANTRDLTILVEAPSVFEVPPLRTVEDKIKTGLRHRQRFAEGTTQRLGEEQGIGIGVFAPANQKAPEINRHLVSGVAAKTAEAQRRIVRDQLAPVLPQVGAIRTALVVDFEQVTPGLGDIPVLDRGMHRLARGVVLVPGRMLLDQRRI